MEIVTLLLVASGLAASAVGTGGAVGWAVWIAVLAFAMAIVLVARGRWQAVPLVATSLAQAAAAAAAHPDAMAPWLIVLLAGGHAGAALWLWWWPIPHLPAMPGPHAVGLQIGEFPVPDTAGVLSRRADGQHWLQLHVWYPAREETGNPPRALRTRPEAHAMARATRSLGGRTWLFSHYRLARTNTRPDALPLPGRFPLVVFNHGGAMWPAQSFALMEALASRGCIVCSLAHPGESLAVVWRNGETTLIDPAIVASIAMQGDALRDQATFALSQDDAQRRALLPALAGHFGPTLGETTRRWANSSMAAVDHLIAGPADPQLAAVAAQADFSRLAYAGMSLGGSVASACCFADRRARVGINLDGSNWTFEHVDRDIPTPVLQLYGDPTAHLALLQAHAGTVDQPLRELDATTRLPNDFFYEAPEDRGRRDDIVRISLRDTGHMGFTDHALAARGPVRGWLGTGLASGPQTSRTIAELTCAFIDSHLKSGDRMAFDRTLAAWPDLVRQQLPAAASGAG